MLLDFLRPHIDVGDNEIFSLYPGKSNNPGDLIKGRTFRRLNVTRKIVIKGVPSLINTALDMQISPWVTDASASAVAVLWEAPYAQRGV